MSSTGQDPTTTAQRSLVSTALRIIGALALTGIATFCVFGFLATYELGVPARLPWQRGYALTGMASVVGVVLLRRPRSGRQPKS